jgi:hypothetical protein
VTIDYRIVLEDRAIPVTALAPADLRAAWSGPVTCCTLQGSFFLHVDGEAWNADAVDEIAMSQTWLSATIAVLRGSPSQAVWAWEESGMTMVRHGDLVELYDVHNSGRIVCPPVVFDLRAFARALADAAEPTAALFDAVLADDGFHDVLPVLEQNLRYAWREDAATIRALCEELPPPWSDASDALHAIRLNDAARLRRALETTSPDAVEERRPLVVHAASLRRPALVRLLLEAGADPDALEGNGGSALTAAVGKVHDELVDLLLDHGAAPSGGTPPPLFYAASYARHAGDDTLVRRLLSPGADPEGVAGDPELAAIVKTASTPAPETPAEPDAEAARTTRRWWWPFG